MTGRLALLWRGDREARANATTENNRYLHVFAALSAGPSPVPWQHAASG
jgi:hypothetical protein